MKSPIKNITLQNKVFLKKIIFNIFIFLVLWILFYNVLRKILFIDYLYEQVIFYLTKIQLVLSKIFLNFLGYQIDIFGKTIKIIGSRGVHLDRGCLGRNTLGMFIGFILIIPGKLKDKIWFIFLGVVIFIILNVSRIVGLTIIEYCCRQNLDFNHHFLFKIIIYFIIFILWTWWIKKYSLLKNKQ